VKGVLLNDPHNEVRKGVWRIVSLLALIFISVLEFGSISNARKYFYSCIQLHLARSQCMNKVHKYVLGFVSVLLYFCMLLYYISKAIQR